MKLGGKRLTFCDVGCYFLQFNFHCQVQGHYYKYTLHFFNTQVAFVNMIIKVDLQLGEKSNKCHKFSHLRYDLYTLNLQALWNSTFDI